MKYDKKSFCAGIAVGTQLKGWASFNGNSADDSGAASHVFPKAAQLRAPRVLPVQSFGYPPFRAAVLNAPAVIPVYSYEGSEL